MIGLTVAAVAAAAPAAASADHDDPEITRAPSLSGSALVGSRLDAVGATWRGAGVSVDWLWMRCDRPDSWRSCDWIEGARTSSYTVTADDLGKYLRALLLIGRGRDYDYEITPASALVASPPPPAPPAPPPLPSPPVVAPQPVAPPVVATPKVMRPAPKVRIRGYLTRRGARVTLLTVRAPRGARISVRCKGVGCPRGAPAHAVKLTRLRSYERMLRARARIVIRVTRRGYIGKHTVIRIRSGKAPLRRDRCLYPGNRKPVACPAD